MGFLDRAKVASNIAKIAAEIYGLVLEKGRKTADREARIKVLEAELAELKKGRRDRFRASSISWRGRGHMLPSHLRDNIKLEEPF